MIMRVGSLVRHHTGEWASARWHIGVVLDFRKSKDNKDEALVYLPTDKPSIHWHTIDDWHLKHFWTVES